MPVEQVVGETGRQAVKAAINEMKTEKVAEAVAKVAETVVEATASGSYRDVIDQFLLPARVQAELVLDKIESFYPDLGSIYPFLLSKWNAFPSATASMWRSFLSGCAELGSNAATNTVDFANWLKMFFLTLCQVVANIFTLLWSHICQFCNFTVEGVKSFATWCFVMTVMFCQDCIARLEKVPIPTMMGVLLFIGFIPIVYYVFFKPKKKVTNTFTPRVKGQARENDGVTYRLFSAISPPSVFKQQADEVEDDIKPEDAIEADGTIEGGDEPCEDDDDKISILSVASSAVSALSNASRKLAKKATKVVKKAVKPILEDVEEGDEDESESESEDEQEAEPSPEPIKKRTKAAFMPVGPDGKAIEAPVRRSKRLAQ